MPEPNQVQSVHPAAAPGSFSSFFRCSGSIAFFIPFAFM